LGLLFSNTEGRNGETFGAEIGPPEAPGTRGEGAGRECDVSDDVAEAAVGTLKELKECHVTTDLLMKTQVRTVLVLRR